MSDHLYRSFKLKYDNYFDQKTIKNETDYLHYFVPEYRKPIKMKIKSYSSDGQNFELQEYFVGTLPEKRLEDYETEIHDENKIISEQSLLEIPIQKLKNQILEELAEKESMAIENPIVIDENVFHSKENLLWTDKYLPKSYYELLSDDKINREVLTWLKTWDPIVFKRKLPHKYIPRKPDEAIIPEPQKRWEMTYDLGNKQACDLLRNKMILLAGPPGSGKTTLARVLATHCGYEPVEINASDERTANILIEKIENLTKSEGIKTKNESRPPLVIVDEVDGTLESEYSGAISALMRYIYNTAPDTKDKDRKDALAVNTGSKSKSTRSLRNIEGRNDENEDPENISDEESNTKNSKTKKKPGINIKRPIIFICNDPYSKALKDLRKHALIFHFQKAESSKLMKRLLEICKTEKLLIDHDLLSKICEQNDNDIRSCLNALEFLARRKANKLSSKTLKDETFLVKREMAKNLFDVIDDILVLDDGKAHKGTTKAKSKKMNITNYALNYLPRNAEYSYLSEGIFLNYTKLKNVERDLSKVCDLMDSLIDSDILNKEIYKTQGFELLKYTNLFAIQAHLKIASNERVKFEFPSHNVEIRKTERFVEQIVDSIYDPILPKCRPFYPRKNFVTEYVSFIYQIIQPEIKNPILDQIEKADLENAIYVMIDFGIEMLQNTTQIQNRLLTEFFQSEFSPSIERLLMFQNVKIEKRFSEKVRALVHNNYKFLKNMRLATIAKEMEDENKPENSNQGSQQVNARNIPHLIEAYENENLKTKKRKEPSESLNPFIYKFREGYSNAVRYDVKISYFFRSYDPSH